MARRTLTPEQESWLFRHFPNMTNKDLAEKLTDMLREENQRQLAQEEYFTFHRVSGLEGFEEVLHNIQTCTTFVAVSDISQGYTELNNTPHTRRIKTVFLAMRQALDNMTARKQCMDTMRELFRQYMSVLIQERTRIETEQIYLDSRISFQEIDTYFASGCACAYFQIATDTYCDLRFNSQEWS